MVAEADPGPTTGSLPEVSRRRWNAALALNVLSFIPPWLGLGFFVIGRWQRGLAWMGMGVAMLATVYLAAGVTLYFGEWDDPDIGLVVAAAVLAFAALLVVWIGGIMLIQRWREEALLQQEIS